MFLRLNDNIIFRYFIISVLLTVFQVSMYSEPVLVFSQNCKSAYSNLMYLRFNKAKGNTELEKIIAPDNKLIYYFENYQNFLTVLISDESFEYDNYLSKSSEIIDKISSSDKNTPWYYYSLADIYLQSAVLRVLHNDYLMSVYNLILAKYYLSNNIEKYAGFMPNRKIEGVIEIVSGLVPNDYRWASLLLGFSGNLERGLAKLKQFYQYSLIEPCFKTESLLVYFLSLNFINKSGGEMDKVIAEIREQSNKNSILRYVFSSALINNHKSDEALQIIELNKQQSDEYKIPYFDYLEAMSNFYNLKECAEEYFQKFISSYHGRYFINSARLHLAWYYFLNDNFSMYNKLIDDIKANSNSKFEIDKQSAKEASEQRVYNKYLLRARVLFDGGNYKESLNLLKNNEAQFNNVELKDKIEYYYRKARIYHMISNYFEAKKYYKIVIKDGSSLNNYFAANSALQLAIIFEKQNNFQNAKKYYLICIDIAGGEYKYSLELKSKAGIYRIDNFKE